MRIELRPHHRQARLQWARNHLVWPRQQWSRILFTDESRFVLGRHDGRMRVYRRGNERFADQCMHEAPNRGYGQVMVWGGISRDLRTELVHVPVTLTGANYVETILRQHVTPFFQEHQGLTLQQDNAPPHRARITQDYITNNNMQILHPWPAASPDLNPIEHVWDIIGRHVESADPRPQNNAQLLQSLTDAWNDIPQASIRHIIDSMRRRCQAVINAGGGHTRY